MNASTNFIVFEDFTLTVNGEVRAKADIAGQKLNRYTVCFGFFVGDVSHQKLWSRFGGESEDF